jgi:hypothetical protein
MQPSARERRAHHARLVHTPCTALTDPSSTGWARPLSCPGVACTRTSLGTVVRMNSLRTRLTLSALVLMTLVISAMPALAADGGDKDKSQLITRSQHHRVGAVILFVFSLLALFALVNAVKQLRGKREQADGHFRWR